MARNPEIARTTGQFTEINGQATRKPDKHTKRAKLLGAHPTPRAPKAADLINGQRPELLKPQISERQHVIEQLSLGEVAIDSEDTEEFREQGEKVVYSERDMDLRSSPFATLPILLYSEKDDLEPDPLREDSAEGVAAREALRTPDEIEEVWDYAHTRLDQEF